MVLLMRTVHFAVLLVALFILGSVFSIPTAHAVPPPTWNGAAHDGKWETPQNWDCGGGVNCVPAPGSSVIIPNGAFVVTISTTQSIYALIVGLGDTVTCESTCTLTLISLANLGTFTNFGTITTEGLANVGTFTNFGTITVSVVFVNGGTFTNRCHGTVKITPTSGTGTFTTDPTCPAVGGVITTVNVFTILAPWLAAIGLVGCIGIVVVIAKKRHP